ncbi:MAG: DUF4845 domain-containing protein [Fluviicoccus sp.]|uniref:DUF4845 domain-containing protein n=1 Tax=Fluviicoccus sp. TaxID=2003552 RepID=UPI00271F48B8|nr:DUF4845 domain-containing protein [Fluviicoccus sp.]MDO8329365.1 DUF4845 domain-containing protein [Fluviicoccus sp.]
MQGRQKGISYWGVVFGISFFAMAIKVGATIGPIYLDYYTMTKIIAGRFDEPNIDGLNTKDFYQSMLTAMSMNGMGERKIEDLMKIRREGDKIVVDLQYEDRRPLMGNMDVAATFSRSFSSENPNGIELAPAEAE